MLYECTIIDINEEEVKIQIGDTQMVCFANCGCEKRIGEICNVEIILFDDLKIEKSLYEKSEIVRKGNTYSYELIGILDVDNCKLKSVIDFDIDSDFFLDYGYLDGKYVSVKVRRMDLDFV